jgi:uncharacterized protein YdeI (YjbR/CyaY-like superfamily)
MEEYPRFHPENRAAWRAWLAEHHGSAAGVWLVFWKAGANRPGVSYDQAVEEALCFGWIDGTARGLDAERRMIRFSPRRPGSVWARSNKERVARLEAAGLMTVAGRAAVEAARANGSWTRLDSAEALEVPDDLAAALDASPRARRSFEALSASMRKMTLGWIATAKRAETRAGRISRVAGLAERGELASLWRRD